jgi:hypothetical protein
MSSDLLESRQGEEFSSNAFEEFKLELYEALLDLIEDLRRIKSERQKDQKEDQSEPVGSQL